jgi:hypothetical protein
MRIEHARATVAGLVVVAAVACSPGAPLPAPVGSPLTATALRDSVRVSLTLEGPPLAGQLSWADGRVDNLGPKAVRWAGGGCNDPVGIFIEFGRAFDPGRVWPGLLGRFKAVSLGADGGSPTNIGYEEQSRIRPPDQIPISCPADLRVNELAPGASRSIRAAWNGTLGGPAPAPAGPATVTGWFEFIGIAGEVGDDVTTTKPIKAAIETTIVGPAASSGAGLVAPLSPALAIDAALADPEFAVWVKADPELTWVNPNIVLQDGTWAIGLFKGGKFGDAPTRYGELKIDARGQIVGRRFDP